MTYKPILPLSFVDLGPRKHHGYRFQNTEPATSLGELAQVNIFVGQNNSGKSRLLRRLASGKWAGQFAERGHKFVDSLCNTKREMLQAFAAEGTGGSLRADISGLPDLQPRRFALADFERFEELFRLCSEQNAKVLQGGIVPSRLGEAERNKVAKELYRISDTGSSIAAKLRETTFVGDPAKVKRIYIPTLRGLRSLSNGDPWKDRIVSDHFEKPDVPVEVFTGLDMFERVRKLLLGTRSERRQIDEYEKFLSTEFFEGASLSLIPREDKGSLHVKIGLEAEQPVSELGEGIQALIAITFLAFIVPNAFFFVEEPELFLHPGLQRSLLAFLSGTREGARHTFFVTSHSNHFLDMSMDFSAVSIFRFQKVHDDETRNRSPHPEELLPEFLVERVGHGHPGTLESLGVRASSVFLVNATIWIEGITDRWYLRRFIELYLSRTRIKNEQWRLLKEDVHYSFVEYAGANITHWSFLQDEADPIEVKRLCSDALLITDEDGEAAKTNRKARLEAYLGERYVCLPVREIENILSADLIWRVVRDYERLHEDDTALPLKPRFKRNAYDQTYLGKFIEDQFTELAWTRRRKASYKAESGTVNMKLEFCRKAISLMQQDDLDETISELVERVLAFIEARNLR